MAEPVQPEVLVVGAGPVGLSAALRLGRSGVRVHVVERRTASSHQPRAHVVNGRTMELFRSWGIADAVRAEGLALEEARSFAWLTRMRDDEFARLDYISEQVAEQSSPERLSSCAQDRIEAVLLDAVRATPGVTVDFGSRAVGLTQDEDGVVVEVVRPDGTSAQHRPRYVLACDGASSPTRALTGVGMHQTEPLGRKVNIYFHADLDALTRRRPFILWFVHHPRSQGIFITLASHRWVFSVDMAPGESADDYGVDRCRELIRDAVGDPELEPDVRSVMTWSMDTAVADRFRCADVFFVGDAAHRFPPTGGFGMNSGIQDADNLAWKLALVLRGGADDALLDSYEAERRPVAEYNVAQCVLNARRQQEAAARMADPQVLELLASPEGGELRAAMAAGIAELKEEFHSLGQQFGHVYTSAAVVDDGSPPRESTITDYRMTARPGARAPHARLRTATDRQLSTVDLVTGGWTLLAAGPGELWREAAQQVSERTLLDLRVVAVRDLPAGAAPPDGDYADEGEPGAWRRLYELSDGGAVLVRPDGHVASRFGVRPDDPALALIEVVELVLRSRSQVPAPA